MAEQKMICPAFVGSIQYQRACRKAWYEAHPEALKERARGYRKTWYERHLSQIRSSRRNRYAHTGK